MRKETGATLFEILTVFALIGILGGIAATNLRSMTKPLSNAAYSTEQFLQLVRSRAISGTEYYKVRPASSTSIEVLKGDTCAGATTILSDISLTYSSGAHLLDTTWFVCFNSRGRANTSVSFYLSDSDGKTKQIKIALGGGIKIAS